MKTYCKCNHQKTRHRQMYGDPHTGACHDCHCSQMKAERYELYVGERRILASIAQSGAIGVHVLADQLQRSNDPAKEALQPIIYNLQVAGFVKYSSLSTVSATPAGRRHLEEVDRG